MEKSTVTGGAPAKHERACWTPRIPGLGEAVLMVDVEQFRVIRGQHGVRAADSVARLVSDRLRQALRGDDRLACVREDEFMVVLPGAEALTLPLIETRVRATLHRLRVAVQGEVWALSCALGGAAQSCRTSRLDALVRAADQALWHAKRAEQRVG